MIRYALICDKGHDFESWFSSGDDYEKQVKRGFVTCPICNSPKVQKQIMAPAVGRAGESEAGEPATQPVALISEKEKELRAKIKEFREMLMQNSDYVGNRFADEARAMHRGEIERRTVHGEASPDEARSMIEEGVPFLPIPSLPDERN